MKLLKTIEVAEALTLSIPAFHMLRRREPNFPKPVKLSDRTLRWDEEEVQTWLQSKKGVTNNEIN